MSVSPYSYDISAAESYLNHHGVYLPEHTIGPYLTAEETLFPYTASILYIQSKKPLLDSLLPSRAQYALGALIRCAAIGRADISESPNRSLCSWRTEAEHLVCVYLDIIRALFCTGDFILVLYTLENSSSATVHFTHTPPRFPRPAVRHRDMEPPNTSRPLAPAPPNARRSQSERPNQPQRENVSSACSQCKTRKQKVQIIHSRQVTNINPCVTRSLTIFYMCIWIIKCGGGQPCDYCSRTGKNCVIDESTDMRRKMCIKRKIDDLEENQDMLQNLFDTLRDSNDEKAVQLFQLIRSKVPLADIKNSLNNGDGLDETKPEMSSSPDLQNVLTKSQEDDSPPPDRRRMLDIRRLVDEPPFRVPARPWTVITRDDTLVSHLVSLWLTWSHPFWNSLNRKLFIRDMQAGRLECEFCSPFLVNAILAEACVSYLSLVKLCRIVDMLT